jgi:glutathione S-transferase
MKLYYFETLNPRKACAVAQYLGSPVEFVRVDLRKNELPAWREPFPAPKAAAAA